ncbi:4800_t:CDS:1, partial [Funneliformis geosporum]
SPITEKLSTKKARQDNNNNKTTENKQQMFSQNNISPPMFMKTETINFIASSFNDKEKNPETTLSSVSTNNFDED